MKPTADFNPSKTAIVQTGDAVNSSVDSTAQVTIESYKPNEITLNTSSEKDQFLVLSEIYYPVGWEATIDGESTEIYKTNFVLRGLQIPAGEHSVNLTYEPISNIWGGRIAWAGHIVLYILGITIVVKSFRKQDQA